MNNLIEKMNTIEALDEQISALLDLIMLSEDGADHKSIKIAAEMVLTMYDELVDIAKKTIDELKDELITS